MVSRRITSRTCALIAVSLILALGRLLTAAAPGQNSIYANTAPQTEPDKPKTPTPVAVLEDESQTQTGRSPAPHPDSSAAAANPDDGQAAPSSPAGLALEAQSLGQRRQRSDNPQQDSGKPAQMPSAWRTLGSLLIVLVLIVGAAYFLRRFSFGGRRKAYPAGIEVLARNSISPKQSLCLVKLGQRLLLLGLSPNHMTALQTIDDPEDIALVLGLLEKQKDHSITNTFNRLFQREHQHYEGEQNTADNDDDGNRNHQTQQWYQAKGELTTLLDKVKGLSRIRFRP